MRSCPGDGGGGGGGTGCIQLCAHTKLCCSTGAHAPQHERVLVACVKTPHTQAQCTCAPSCSGSLISRIKSKISIVSTCMSSGWCVFRRSMYKHHRYAQCPSKTPPCNIHAFTNIQSDSQPHTPAMHTAEKLGHASRIINALPSQQYSTQQLSARRSAGPRSW
jgi:hypothetical protein